MASKKANKTTVFTTNYVSCMWGAGLKGGVVYVASGASHPETVLEDLKKYYGNEIKGYYCKTVDTLESISTKLEKQLEDKNNLSQYLYEVKVTDIKKIIKTVTDSKTGSTMGPVKIKAAKDDDEDDEEESEDEPEPPKKAVKETKKDEKKTEKKEEKKDEKKADAKKVVAKEVKEKDTKKKEATAKITKEEPVKKSNKTVINLSDDSDDDDDEEEN